MADSLRTLEPVFQELFALSGSPGLSLGVLHQGSQIYTKHYGRRQISAPHAPDDDTLFNVASFTKLMTAGVVSNLVELGLMEWDSPIHTYVPEFKKRSDLIGQKASVEDLIANRTGLSAQNTFWGVMFEEILSNPDEIPNIACHIESVGEFRKTFTYSTWGYGLVTCAIERVSKKPFSQCVEELVFRPLGMFRSCTNEPTVDNVAGKHYVTTEGQAYEFPWSRGWSDQTGFAAAVAARSSIKELLLMYKSLLSAYNDQGIRGTNSTPGSPFKYARRILSPQIGVGRAPADKYGYCLGTYRTRLPGTLSLTSFNTLLLGKKNMAPFGGRNAGRVIHHQIATFTGYNGSMFLDTETETAVIVLVNSLPLFDITDIIGQSVLSSLFGEKQFDAVFLANSVKSRNLLAYDFYNAELAKKKTELPLPLSLAHFEGDYWNKDGLICFAIRALNDRQLHMTIKDTNKYSLTVRDKHLTNWRLRHWGGTLFIWLNDRETDAASSIWPFQSLKVRMFRFNCTEGDVQSFTWHHDLTPGIPPEIFSKLVGGPITKL